MHRHRNTKPPRYVALLPNGERLAPGATEVATGGVLCGGPDELGRCPAVLAGQDRVCDEADWYVLDDIGRPYYVFDSSVVSRCICPLTELDSAARVMREGAPVVAREGAD